MPGVSGKPWARMSLGEFELIGKFFSRGSGRKDVVLGVGDDAALVRVPQGHELVVAADTLVAGVHFPSGADAYSIGYRALAVNLSDMAAMGAVPAWFTLALTLPAADEGWLEAFSRGLLELAVTHRVALIGGDTTSGPLTVTVSIMGLVPEGSAVRRSGARVGDLVCVSGSVGEAAGGLAVLQGRVPAVNALSEDKDHLRQRFLRPEPRVELGLRLRGTASAAIDVSDGLYADLGRLVAASGCAARLDVDALSLSAPLKRCFGDEVALRYALAGGDDYELCFTVPPGRFEALRQAAEGCGVPVHRIGVVEAGQGVRCCRGGRAMELQLQGYDHFRRSP